MLLPSDAEENLRVIRSLMEKATVYRAISAPGAMIGGVLSLGLSGVMLLRPGTLEAPPFQASWISVLVFTALANFWLLKRDAARRGERFVSPGMKLALRAMVPALLAGGLGGLLCADGGEALTASLWVLLYGVSLLAASHFAPRSICWLGRAFFVTGAGLIVAGNFLCDWWRGTDQTFVAHAIMGATFGAFHLIYAACTWPRAAAKVGSEP